MKNNLDNYLSIRNVTLRGYPVKSAQMHFGVRPGWYNLLQELFEKLFARGWDGQLTQVKEKFGELRVYLRSVPDNQFKQEIRDLLCEYSVRSTQVCEICGIEGDMVELGGHYWTTSKCYECREKDDD